MDLLTLFISFTTLILASAFTYGFLTNTHRRWNIFGGRTAPKARRGTRSHDQDQLQAKRSKKGSALLITPARHIKNTTLGYRGTDATYHEKDVLKTTDKEVKYDTIAPSSMRKEILKTPGAFVVHHLLSKHECDQLISISESMGYTDSPLRDLGTQNAKTSKLGSESRKIRNSKRVLFDANWDKLARVMNERLLSFLPNKVSCEGSQWIVDTSECINSRWRFNRYDKGGYFKPHFDAGYVYNHNRKTLMTYILYLNDGFTGGTTTFFPGNKTRSWLNPVPGIEEPVTPVAGKALVFFQVGKLSPRHEGGAIGGHVPKYILRSDLIYLRVT